jgi:hypothetical protein
MRNILRKTTRIIDDETFSETVSVTLDLAGFSDLHIMSVLGAKTDSPTYTVKVYTVNSHGDDVLYDTLTTLNAGEETQFKTYTDFPTSTAVIEIAYGGTGSFAHVKTEVIQVKR